MVSAYISPLFLFCVKAIRLADRSSRALAIYDGEEVVTKIAFATPEKQLYRIMRLLEIAE